MSLFSDPVSERLNAMMLAELEKRWQDQPRDARGRWTHGASLAHDLEDVASKPGGRGLSTRGAGPKPRKLTGPPKMKPNRAAAEREASERQFTAEHQASGMRGGTGPGDKIPSKYRNVPREDFAGPHGSYPIRRKSDIAHAASLAHHAANPTQVRANIAAIARRKWPRAKPPPSLTSGKPPAPSATHGPQAWGAGGKWSAYHPAPKPAPLPG